MSDFADMMPHSVVVAEPSGVDAYGQMTYATGTTYSALVRYQTIVIQMKDKTNLIGEIERSFAAVYVEGDYSFSRLCRVTLPDGTKHIPKDIQNLSAETTAVHHTRFLL